MPDPTDGRLFRSRAARQRVVLHALAAAIALLVGTVVLRRELPFLFNVTEARAFVASFGLWAPLVLVVIQAGQVVVAPIPGQVLAVVAGYLFGVWLGTFLSMVGITIGSTIAFWIGRRFGRAYVERFVHPAALEQFDGIEDRHALATLFVLFLIPGLPDDVLCFAGGLTRIPIRRLVLFAILGRTPASFLANAFGDLLGIGDRSTAALVLIVLLAVSGLGYLYRHRIIGALSRVG